MRVDFSGVQTGFEPLPADHYLVAITDGELKEAGEEAKNPGSEYINWELTVQQGDFEGRKLFTNTTLLPNALFGLKGLLAATGKWTKEELDSDAFDFDIADVIGQQVIAVVSVGSYKNEPTNNVKRFRTVSDLPASGDAGLLP